MKLPKSLVEQQFGESRHLGDIQLEYNRIRNLVIDLYDHRTWFMTEVALSVAVSCLLADLTNPMAVIFLSGPSTGKTTVLDFFLDCPSTILIDKFTPASFLTQSGKVDTKKLTKVDLLPQLPYKTVILPEMGPTFSQPREQLMENYGVLARVLDGNGLANAGGVHGRRELTGDYVFSMLGASTPLTKTAWDTMGKVGSRLLFLSPTVRSSKKSRRNRALQIMRGDVDYMTKKSVVSKAIQEYLALLLDSAADENWIPPAKAPTHLTDEKSFISHCGYRPRSIHWDKTNDDIEAHQCLASIAEFVTCARKDLLFYTDGGERRDIDSSISVAVEEGVERFTTLIYNLARCRAILLGRRYITVDDVSIPLNCAMDSLPNDRRSTIELLVDTSLSLKSSNPGSFTLNELMQVLDCSQTKARDTMRLMNKIGIGTAQIGLGPGPSLFHLDNDYAWFTTDSFHKLYRPWDESR